MKIDVHISIEPMMEEDVAQAVELIAAAMNEDEANWAGESMRFYFDCKRHELDSGRSYYVWRHLERICGLVGLHRYIWGPEENVWLSWFAVHPEYQEKNIGSAMIDAVEKLAKQAGYRKLFVETYDHPTFEKARSFYRSKGFSQTGRVDDYLPDGSALLVFSKRIT